MVEEGGQRIALGFVQNQIDHTSSVYAAILLLTVVIKHVRNKSSEDFCFR